jgi:hypothetical protein
MRRDHAEGERDMGSQAKLAGASQKSGAPLKKVFPQRIVVRGILYRTRLTRTRHAPRPSASHFLVEGCFGQSS